MSYSSHRRKVLDNSISLKHRASHARSCALHVSYKLRLDREVIIQAVAEKCGVSLHNVSSSEDIIAAFKCLDSMRQGNWVIED